MNAKKMVVEALNENNISIKEINSPLSNLIIICDKWLCEFDPDGALSIIISKLGIEGNYMKTHRIIYFHGNEEKDELYNKISDAIRFLNMNAA